MPQQESLFDRVDRSLFDVVDEQSAAQAPQPTEGPGILDRAAGMLPTAGALAGGIIGGIGGTAFGLGIGGAPGAVGGAALGGAAGDAAHQLYQQLTGDEEAPQSPTDAAKQLGIVAVREGGLQAAGGAAAKGLTATGRGLYKAGASMLPRALKQEFPTLAEDGFREGIAMTRRGAEKAATRASASADEADALIASRAAQTAQVLGPSNPGRAPGFVSIGEALEDVPGLRNRAMQGALGTQEPAAGQMENLARTMSQGHRWPMQLPDAQAMKRAEQTAAHNVYRALDKGHHVPAIAQTRGQFAKAVASGTRRSIENHVPDVAPINARTQSLMGLERAAEHASETNHVMSRLLGAAAAAGAVSPAGVVPAMAAGGAALAGSTPAGLTSLGLLTKGAAKGVKYAPEAVRSALLAEMLARELAVSDEQR